MSDSADVRRSFADAAEWFVDVVGAVDDRWDSAGLGEWTVRDLVGHTSRALLTVESYLTDDAGRPELSSPVEYVQAAMAGIGDPAAVAQRGRDAGVALGAQPHEAVAMIADRVVALVDRTEDTAVTATPAGRIRLIDYLPARTFELTVHTCDLAVAVGIDSRPPQTAALAAIALCAELATERGESATVLLALTGRRPLPDGYSVLA